MSAQKLARTIRSGRTLRLGKREKMGDDVAGEARNHHWVPQCYLKGFAKSRSKNAQLYVVDMYARSAFTTVPRNVASARDFNRIEVDGFAPNHIEARYADFEGLAARALQKMDEANGFGNAEEHNLVLNLIALLAVRGPVMRENVRRFQERVVKLMMSHTVATKERYDSSFGKAAQAGFVESDNDITYESMREFVEGEQYTIEVPTTRHVELELDLVDTILPLLGRRTWLLLRAPVGGAGFVTSDHPVGLQWTEQRKRGMFSSPRFGLRGTEVIFPVSQSLALVGTFDGRHGIQDIEAEQVALVNGVIISHAHRQIYARDDRFVYMLTRGAPRRGVDLLRDLHGREERPL